MDQKQGRKTPPETRQAILEAARSAFARHPYNSASIRMIAAHGGFGHALIGYYFPTKAALFEAVAADICADLFAANVRWLAQVRPLTPAEGLTSYVQSMIDLSRKKPWIFQIIMLNIAENRERPLPGQEHLTDALDKIRDEFARTMGITASKAEISRFTDSFNAMALYFLGARESAAWLLRMNPDGPRYFDWVARTLVDFFLPMVQRLLPGPAARQ